MTGRDTSTATDEPCGARDERGYLLVTDHAEVVALAHDPIGFSNAVSRFLQIPNGLDASAHTAARALLDPFFADERIDELEPVLRATAERVLDEVQGHSFDAVMELGARFAVRAQSKWLGWDPALEGSLLSWVRDSGDAAREQDAEAVARAAEAFDAAVRMAVRTARADPSRPGATGELARLRTAEGRLLSDDEMVSVLRNWTGGDLATLARCAGVLCHWMAEHPERQAAIPTMSAESLDATIDEILRLDDPFVSNRRRTTRNAVVAGCPVRAGEIVVLDWREANRDPKVFEPGFDPERNAAANVVYGTGVHVCPGRTLATRELRVLAQAVAARGGVVLDAQRPPVRERAPLAGFRSVPVVLRGL